MVFRCVLYVLFLNSFYFDANKHKCNLTVEILIGCEVCL